MSNASLHLEHCRGKNHADLLYKMQEMTIEKEIKGMLVLKTDSEITQNTRHTKLFTIQHSHTTLSWFVLSLSVYTHFILPCGESWSAKIVLSALSELAESRDDPISFIRQDRRRTAPVTLKNLQPCATVSYTAICHDECVFNMLLLYYLS